jgi:hypothetical protein
MREPLTPLPLSEVMRIVDRRRQRRAMVRTATGSALAVAAVGLTGVLAVTLRERGAVEVPAGPAPVAPTVVARPTPTASPSDAAAGDVPFQFRTLTDEGFVDELADALYSVDTPQAEIDAWVAEGDTLSEEWQVPFWEAKAILELAEIVGEPVDPADPQDAADLVQRFEQRYTPDDAAALADFWQTDARSAAILGGLIGERDSLEPESGVR